MEIIFLITGIIVIPWSIYWLYRGETKKEILGHLFRIVKKEEEPIRFGYYTITYIIGIILGILLIVFSILLMLNAFDVFLE
jgi:hypothetical protein